jgi:hypothetical protein
MGHASPRAAMIYQHATSERDRLIADALNVGIIAARSKGTTRDDDRDDGTAGGLVPVG